MNDRLDDFRNDLMAGVARHGRRRRRRRIAVGAATFAVATTAAAGASTSTLDPLSLFHRASDGGASSPFRPTADLGARLALDGEAGGTADPWSAVAYVSARAGLCLAVATRSEPTPSITCRGGFPIADGFSREALPVSYATIDLGEGGRPPGRTLVYGVVADSVADLRIRTGDDSVGVAVTEDAVTLEVPKGGDNLTAEGRTRSASFPDELRLRLFAAEVPTTRVSAGLRITGTVGGRTAVRGIPPAVP